MSSSIPENPYRVLLGSSFTLFLALLLSIPLAYLGVALYLSVTGSQLPLQISPSASMWELRLEPERAASDEHERLKEELWSAHPDSSFVLSQREDDTWLVVHARSEQVFEAARSIAAQRGYDSGQVRRPGLFDMLRPDSMQVSLAWFGEHPGAVMAATSSQSISFAVLGLILIVRARNRKFVWTSEPAPVGRRILEGLVGGLVLIAASFVVATLSAWLGRPVVEQPWVTKILLGGGEARWMLWTLVVVIAPIAEELFFRGYLFQSLDVRISTPLAFAVSTAYFAGVHGNPSGLFVYLVLGVGLAALHWRTRSLLAPILAHSLVNAFALAG